MVTFKLNNTPLTHAPVEWQDIEIQVDFTTNAGATITTDNFTFPLSASQEITNYINGGINGTSFGIFEGLDFDIEITEGLSTLNIFKGFLDFNDFEVIDPCKVKSKIKKLDAYDTLYERLQSNTFGYLREQGIIQPTDYVQVQYVVQKEFDYLEVAVLSLATFMSLKQTIEAIRDIGKTTTDQVEAGVPNANAGGPIVNIPKIVGNILNAIIQIAYVVALVIYTINLITELMAYLYPPMRKKKCMKVKRLLEIACVHVGYNLDCNIPELENLYYFPSHTTTRKYAIFVSIDDEGIPQTSDYGYRCSEILDLVQNLFNAKVKVDNNTVMIRSENDTYWQQTSTYIMPNVLTERYRYNTEELIANRLISFQTDQNDTWTLKNFKGTNFEVITSPVSLGNSKKVLIKGLEHIDIPLTLGNRKDGLSTLENSLKFFAGIVDTLTGTNFAGQINGRIGVLKVSSDVVGIAKLLYLNNALKLDTNHRVIFCAKALYDRYYNYKSFVLNNFGYQKKLYTEITVPFCLHNMLELLHNNYFTTNDNKRGYIQSIRWNIDNDTAVLDYCIFEPYTKNLKETYIEPI